MGEELFIRGWATQSNYSNKVTTSQQLLTSYTPLERRAAEPLETQRPAKLLAKGMFMGLIF